MSRICFYPDSYTHEKAQSIVDSRNKDVGELNVDHYCDGVFVKGDGIDCDVCHNVGRVYQVYERDGQYFVGYKTCECIKQRIAVERIRKSGLDRVIGKYTFDNFNTDNPWQKKMLDVAKDYVAQGAESGAWLYVGGQSGCGKSHICTAVAGELMKNRDLTYVVWSQVAQRLKSIINDGEAYQEQIAELQDVDVLYIDDLFKPARDFNGVNKGASPADIRLIFDIANVRYLENRPTIFSSEWLLPELSDLDEAVASRIFEKCEGKYMLNIGRDKAKNLRFKDIEML